MVNNIPQPLVRSSIRFFRNNSNSSSALFSNNSMFITALMLFAFVLLFFFSFLSNSVLFLFRCLTATLRFSSPSSLTFHSIFCVVVAAAAAVSACTDDDVKNKFEISRIHGQQHTQSLNVTEADKRISVSLLSFVNRIDAVRCVKNVFFTLISNRFSIVLLLSTPVYVNE